MIRLIFLNLEKLTSNSFDFLGDSLIKQFIFNMINKHSDE